MYWKLKYLFLQYAFLDSAECILYRKNIQNPGVYDVTTIELFVQVRLKKN